MAEMRYVIAISRGTKTNRYTYLKVKSKDVTKDIWGDLVVVVVACYETGDLTEEIQ